MRLHHNRYKGEYPIEIGGNTYVMVFDWDAIARAHEAYGNEAIAELFRGFYPDVLAGLMEIALKKHHPDMTADIIKELSPPYIPCASAIDKAMAYAYFGVDEAPTEKKTLMQWVNQTLLRNQ